MPAIPGISLGPLPSSLEEAVSTIRDATAKARQYAKALQEGGPITDGIHLIDHEQLPVSYVVKLQAHFRKRFGSDKSGYRIIGPSWLRNIGHIATLGLYFKAKALGMLEQSETVICCDNVIPANLCLVRYFEPFTRRIAITRDELGEHAKHFELLEESTAAVLLRDGRTAFYQGLYYDVGVRWAAEARGPLLSLTEEHRDAGRRYLRSLAMPDDAWFVTFHARQLDYQPARSVREETYYRAIERVAEVGGWVVCMGMSNPPKHPRVIKFERQDPLQDWQDIYLLAACRFFVGCTSGPLQVPDLFDTPSVMTNMLQPSAQGAFLNDLVIMKSLYSRWHRRALTLDEMQSHYSTAVGATRHALESLDIDVVDNTAEEIEEVVVEMLEKLDGKSAPPSPEEDAAHRRLMILRQIPAAGGAPIFAGKTRLGRAFLRRHGEELGLMDELPSSDGLRHRIGIT